MVALGEISLGQGILITAAIGAAGSVAGDLIIFRFMRDRFAADISELLAHRHPLRRAHALFRHRMFRWFTFLAGGLVLASPLPDEFGISILGLSKMSIKYFIMLSYTFNFLGILAIGFLAKALTG